MQTIKSTFTLPESIIEDLNNISEELGEKKSRIVANALDMYFDYVDLKIAKLRSDDIKSGKEKSLTSKELREELGL